MLALVDCLGKADALTDVEIAYAINPDNPLGETRIKSSLRGE
jgi:hypothetical protein